ncbi:hypothetical protein ACFSTC_12475 [Nonomuraea ferruginea]
MDGRAGVAAPVRAGCPLRAAGGPRRGGRGSGPYARRRRARRGDRHLVGRLRRDAGRLRH